MPTKKTTKSAPAPKADKTKAVKSEKKVAAPKKTSGGSELKTLRAELFSLKMKHSLRELKEVHKISQARKAIARHLTQLHNSK